jgi:hypothetical protein
MAARGFFEAPAYPDYSKHVLLASFPKSGNTWLRFVVSNVNALIAGDVPVTFASINNYAPAIRGNRDLHGARLIEGCPLFLKTHFAYTKYFSAFKSVTIVRDPFMAVSSYLNYLQRQHGKRFSSEEQFFFHWRYGFNAWANFTASWEKEATVVLRYEDVQQTPIESILMMYRAIGYTIEPTLVEKALRLSSRNNMRRTLIQAGDPNNSNGFNFVRNEGENPGLSMESRQKLLRDPRLADIVFDQARKYGYL